jgi:hypothetical protein
MSETKEKRCSPTEVIHPIDDEMETVGGVVVAVDVDVAVVAAAAAAAVDGGGDDVDVFQRPGLSDGIRAHCAREWTVLVHSCEIDLHDVASRRGAGPSLRRPCV